MNCRWLAGLMILFLAPFASADDKAASEWTPLFNGKNLEGWTPKIKGYAYGENHADTFRVEDGIIKVKYDKYTKFEENFGHLFYKEKFSNYILKVEYRFVGDQVKGGPGWATRNSGIMFHCQDPKTMDKEQKFPVSIEAQFLGGLGKGNRTTGNVCTPGTHLVMGGKLITTHCITSKSKTFDGDQWVTMELEVHGGGAVKHIINGETVIEYEKPQYDTNDADTKKIYKEGEKIISEGYIVLQAESHPVEFRKIEIKKLAK